jgi:hypothetical protein
MIRNLYLQILAYLLQLNNRRGGTCLREIENVNDNIFSINYIYMW